MQNSSLKKALNTSQNIVILIIIIIFFLKNTRKHSLKFEKSFRTRPDCAANGERGSGPVPVLPQTQVRQQVEGLHQHAPQPVQLAIVFQ